MCNDRSRYKTIMLDVRLLNVNGQFRTVSGRAKTQG